MKKALTIRFGALNYKYLLIVLIVLVWLPVSNSFAVKTTAVQTLDTGETLHLVFMREEEKLARDVYLTLGEVYPENQQFKSIDGSEQRHFDTMKEKLDQYTIEDPNTDTSIGIYTGDDFGWYFTEKFNALVDRGQANELEALYAGAFIEEIDMHDIVHCPEVIVESENGVGEDECGLDYTDEKPLQKSYTNLLEGSKDHLRAYVNAIEKEIGTGNYVAQVLTQEEVDSILGR
ncbi:DUF2202 domain-containing protein [Malonomonas rubra]|uniref:DUF2202 domain-containing protein n=1 Tax=Malonomonas rubra TaxID=57040 RepID=UPI0026F06054|nr:DUF2202 domain-containing protein [Malonomonas rubra]